MKRKNRPKAKAKANPPSDCVGTYIPNFCSSTTCWPPQQSATDRRREDRLRIFCAALPEFIRIHDGLSNHTIATLAWEFVDAALKA